MVWFLRYKKKYMKELIERVANMSQQPIEILESDVSFVEEDTSEMAF